MDSNVSNNLATTISRYEVTCTICSSIIEPGSRMFCFVPPGSNGNISDDNPIKKQPLAWAHSSCNHPNLPPPPPCRHWRRLGRCPALQAGMCAFLHEETDKGASTSLAKKTWGGKRQFVRNQHKNSVFRIFLMQTYGMEYLTQRNSIVVDVAGGKGELGWELLNLSGVECCVIDPRPMNLELVKSKWKKGLFEPKRVGPVFEKWYPKCEDGCGEKESKSPFHIRCFFDGREFVDFIEKDREEMQARKVANKWLHEEIERAKRIVWTAKGLQHEDGLNYNESNETILDETNNNVDSCSTEIEQPSKARELIQKCNLIIGLHPDQAAGEIAKFAISRNIPWCIVPCCVYSQCFTKRKLKDGTHVKTYDHLVRWLCELDPRARVATLDMEGKNKVVYTLPDIYDR